jgi:hypothetical protein
MEIKKYRYYLKVLQNNGTMYQDIQECNGFKIENGMCLFYNLDDKRAMTIVAMYPASVLIIDLIREIKD